MIESLRNEHKNLSKLDNLTKLDRLELLRDMESSLRSIDRSLKSGVNKKERTDQENGLDVDRANRRKKTWFRKLKFWAKS